MILTHYPLVTLHNATLYTDLAPFYPYLTLLTIQIFLNINMKELIVSYRCVHGKCIPLDKESYRCECVEGYRGTLCNQQGELFNPCRRLSCKHGRCQISDKGDAYCHCESGYTGELCDAGRFTF